MQQVPPPSLRRRPCRRTRRARVWRRRRLPKRRPLLQLLRRGSTRGRSRRQKAARVVGDGDGKEEMEMEVVNMELYLENRCIMEENERLRRKALALCRENQILLLQLHHYHHHHGNFVGADEADGGNNNGSDHGGNNGSADGQLPAQHQQQQHQGLSDNL